MRHPLNAPLIFGVGLITVLGAALYLYKKRKAAAKQNVSKKVTIRKQAVRYVFGNKDESLKELFDRTRIIKLEQEPNNETEFHLVIGLPADVEEVIKRIKAIDDALVISTENVTVPIKARGKITGPCGDTLEKLKETTGAMVRVVPIPGNAESENVVITGTAEQILEIKAHVDKAVMVASCVEIYVTGVVSPSKFYIQEVSRSAELKALTTQISAYYEDEKNKEKHQIRKLEIGAFVVAKIDNDDAYYRAKIVEIDPHASHDKSKTILDLFFLDFGDNCYVLPKQIFAMAEQFKVYEHFASEAFLANIKPDKDSAEWSQPANDTFDKLVRVATQYTLRARTTKYLKHPESDRLIPGLELFDPTLDEENIATQMIANGVAESCDFGHYSYLSNSYYEDAGKNAPLVPKVKAKKNEPKPPTVPEAKPTFAEKKEPKIPPLPEAKIPAIPEAKVPNEPKNEPKLPPVPAVTKEHVPLVPLPAKELVPEPMALTIHEVGDNVSVQNDLMDVSPAKPLKNIKDTTKSFVEAEQQQQKQSVNPFEMSNGSH